MKKTKIVCTLGPLSNTTDMFVKLIEAGLYVSRSNSCHGDVEEHLARMNMVYEAEKMSGKTVGMCFDTKGLEIWTTVEDTPNGKIESVTGDKVCISMELSLKGTKEKVLVTYPGLYDDTHVGGHVLSDDGLIDMKMSEKDEKNRELVSVV